MFNRSALIVLVAALLAGLGLWLVQRAATPPTGPELRLARLLPEPRAIPPFALTAGDGQALTPERLRGRWTLVFIGFTHCPDICPTTLAELARAEKRWIEALPEPQHPRILFVSIDPDRDSPERTAEYAHFFSPTALAATAPVPVLEAFAKSLLLVFAKAPLPGGAPDAYTMDHSSQVALIDPEGRFAGFVRPAIDDQGSPLGLPPADLAEDMIALARWRP